MEQSFRLVRIASTRPRPTALHQGMAVAAVVLGIVYVGAVVGVFRSVEFPLSIEQGDRLFAALGTGGLVVLALCFCWTRSSHRRVVLCALSVASLLIPGLLGFALGS